MKKNFAAKALACSLCGVFGLGFLAGCGGIPSNKDALVIMTEELNELYNPFYSTAGTDMDVVGQTQIGMLSTNSAGELAYGADEPTVVLDYEKKTGQPADTEVGEKDSTTVYTFVLKNNIKFSDGVPLTMNDVLFNLYVYLDPAYTGSTTMYSTDIIGLKRYRSQSTNDVEDNVATEASTMAYNRRQELIEIFRSEEFHVQGTGASATYNATPDQMRAAISRHTPSSSYLAAIGLDNSEIEKGKAQLLADYNAIVGDPTVTDKDSDAYKGLFRLELERDYNSAKEAYIEEPYKSAEIRYQNQKVATGFDEVTSFMYSEGYATVKHPQEEGSTQDLTKIEYVTLNYNYNTVNTKEKAINRVYNDKVENEFNNLLEYWSCGSELNSEFIAKAKDVILHRGHEEGLLYPNIKGIVSLGHTTDTETVTIGNKVYKVAQEHKDDGTPKNENEYDVLRITVDGNDPKAEWNFGFTVAPYHYYSDPTQNGQNGTLDLTVNIENNKFGVAWASFDFHKNVLQGNNRWGASKNKVPLGAGPYIATDANDRDEPTATGFYSNQIVYYKANPNFLMGKPKIEHMHYQVISSSNALSTLESGQVHYVEPQFTKENYEELDKLAKKGIGSINTWQLGYGYIGVNAGYVRQLGLRKAIMAAMNTSLALEYYYGGTATNIAWPMSAVSWAYPKKTGYTYDGSKPTEGLEDNNGKDYMQWSDTSATLGEKDIVKQYPAAVSEIKSYVAEAAKEVGGSVSSLDMDITFTIAGSNMYEHPAYLVFKQAMDILNAIPASELGGKKFNITLKPDASALMKLSTGSLEVWAAAWGSTIDPDMYQVYHKNSTATSVLAWGYDDILNDSSGEYAAEKKILNDLAVLIDEGRTTDNRTQRAATYKEAMGLVLDLAVEMPLYQRQTLYAYNLNVIDEATLPHDENGALLINPYTSPLSRIWEVDFTK